jgi:hypothetical protein
MSSMLTLTLCVIIDKMTFTNPVGVSLVLSLISRPRRGLTMFPYMRK